MITVEIDPKLAKQIANAMKTLADIGKIYRKYGTSAVWTPIAPTYHAPKQRARLVKSAVPVASTAMMCQACGLRHIGKTTERCQCKVKR